MATKPKKPTLGSTLRGAFPVVNAVRNLARAVPAGTVKPPRGILQPAPKPKGGSGSAPAKPKPANLLGAGGVRGTSRDAARSAYMDNALGTKKKK